ncbi:uncharacterized protein BXZ73DRAFT_40141 [Epithele typhae]|uniref:uncharacterized protein n=1 Tax=Epithele typhae TaxID=378194 RepID=UPI0020079808|nr:uncharacterized protein BXZ73DRAFT_40141 [Epithele typhae]KAH9943266.1 hypothetical protein BXZ73DRAFT_40141 [Epithele typhae]
MSVEGRCSPFCGIGSSSPDKGKARARSRSGERDWDRREKEKERERERERDREKELITHPRRVGSPMQRMRESTSAVVVSAVPMEKSSSNRSAGSKRSAVREHNGHPRFAVEALAARTNRTKHGSFDFERPISSGTAAGVGMSFKSALRNMGIVSEPERQHLQRSSSTRAVPGRRETTDESSNGFAHPSSRVLADKGRKSVSDSHPTHTSSRRREFDPSASTPAHPTSHPHHGSHPTSSHPHHSSRSTSSHPHHASRSDSRHHGSHHDSHPSRGNGTSDPQYLTSGQHRLDGIPGSPLSSTSGHSGETRDGSWSRNGGKRTAGRAFHAHGAFNFEPAVPPIPRSPTNRDRRSPIPPRSVSRPTSPSPHSPSETTMSRSQKARVDGKGRSLDLGLGLTWAPSKMREDALLRVGPRTGTHANTTGAMRARSRWGTADEQGRLMPMGVASDVADAFKEVLGDSGFSIFKTYVHRFDVNAIPLDGPLGLLGHVERLLDNAGVEHRRKRILLERLARVVREAEGVA